MILIGGIDNRVERKKRMGKKKMEMEKQKSICRQRNWEDTVLEFLKNGPKYIFRDKSIYLKYEKPF